MAKKGFDPFDYPKARIPKYYPVNNIVLFFDIVEFTKIPTNEEMMRIIQKIENVINSLLWEDYNWNEKNKHNDLILIPTGDGYGIGFHPNFEAEKTLKMASELFVELTTGNGFKIRMGLARGPNVRHLDRNDVPNLFGYGINLANRVMSVALADQVLVHGDLASDILRTGKIKKQELVAISEPLEIKHGEKIKVYEYKVHTEKVG
ncbi:MAG: adenylate/guanylate cyclase domain-containing protein [Desulfobaccales bacterium]